MTHVHRDCFIGSDAVDFLVTQGLADTRKQAVLIGKKMVEKKMIRHIATDRRRAFRDAYLYYRFTEDDDKSSCVLAPSNAGNGTGIHLGQGGCKFSFSPHTAHNSYVLDIALAEEIERAVAGASVESRARAVSKLRARVKEQAEADAPDWMLQQSTEVNKTVVSVYTRKRPRGDFRNVKITGMVGESPRGFISRIVNFDSRRQWESTFEDGVVVEAVDIGEVCPLTQITEDSVAGSYRESTVGEPLTPLLPDSQLKSAPTILARTTDDLITFLQTVDLAGGTSLRRYASELNDW